MLVPPCAPVAFVACYGGCHAQSCAYGCLGCGACVQACPQGAISFTKEQVPQVEETLCLGCGACERACPQGIIHLLDRGVGAAVRCSHREEAKAARVACSVSCIGCGLCQRVCPSGAAQVWDNLCAIDESLCVSCGMCIAKCPRKAIFDRRNII